MSTCIIRTENNNQWNYFNVSCLSFVWVRHIAQSEWLHIPLHYPDPKLPTYAQRILFCTKLSKIMTFFRYWSFVSPKMLICATFDFPKDTTDRKLRVRCGNIVRFYFQNFIIKQCCFSLQRLIINIIIAPMFQCCRLSDNKVWLGWWCVWFFDGLRFTTLKHWFGRFIFPVYFGFAFVLNFRNGMTKVGRLWGYNDWLCV